MVLQGLTSWVLGKNEISKDPDQLDISVFDKGQFSEDVYLPHEQIRNIHERIRRCLDDDDTGTNQEIDETLRLMRDETEKWYTDPKVSIDFDPASSYFVNDELANVETASGTNELVGYCLRLERNNAYLLQLIEKFEQVSFKKRYNELLTSNNKLQQEYTRLKSTNSKIYTSYCDILEEIKKFKSENESLKRTISQQKEDFKTKNIENLRLKEEIKKLTVTNDNSVHKISDLRKTSATVQRQLSEKENEISKLKGINIATKLKLERAESIVLKTQNSTERKQNHVESSLDGASSVNEKPSYELKQKVNLGRLTDESNENRNKADVDDYSNDENIDSDIEEQDTIAILMQKYQNKAFVT